MRTTNITTTGRNKLGWMNSSGMEAALKACGLGREGLNWKT